MNADAHARPPRPIFRAEIGEWGREILAWGSLPELHVVSAHSRSVAVAVFYAAAEWSEMYAAPIEHQINAWAYLFDRHASWMSVDLAERAVHEFFRGSITGHMLPGSVIHGAAVLRLIEEAQRGA